MTYTNDSDLPQVSDDTLREALTRTRPYTAVILKAGPKFEPLGPDRSTPVAKIIMEHGKRNYALRLAGLLRIVCPIADGSGVAGISIFDTTPEEADRIMSGDPAVRADVLTYEIHPTRSFPGSSLKSEDSPAA
ncbi:MAG TPA: hypothetical protein VFR68_10405 [Candidatus Dormibacteraeota bacterium]|nr:hypothetical protein [Candidatus Dormibacteraeota bacterium]